MPSYRNKVHGTVVHLPDGHRVRLGSEWEQVGAKAKASPAPRRRKAKTNDDE